jgi:hypothetical protein
MLDAEGANTMPRVVYADMPPGFGTRRSIYWWLLSIWLLLTVQFVREASHATAAWQRQWPWMLIELYMVLPILIGTRLLGRLGLLEQQHDSPIPTPEMRRLFRWAIRVVIGGSVLPFVVVRLVR